MAVTKKSKEAAREAKQKLVAIQEWTSSQQVANKFMID